MIGKLILAVKISWTALFHNSRPDMRRKSFLNLSLLISLYSYSFECVFIWVEMVCLCASFRREPVDIPSIYLTISAHRQFPVCWSPTLPALWMCVVEMQFSVSVWASVSVCVHAKHWRTFPQSHFSVIIATLRLRLISTCLPWISI